MSTKAQIVDFLRKESEILLKSSITGTLYGSTLGGMLSKAFPAINLKAEFGGLTPFIQQHCSDFLEHVGKQGGNDLFAASRTRTIARPFSAPSRPTSLWQVYVNPGIQSIIWVEPVTGKLTIGDEPPTEQWKRVDSVTDLEHRNLVKSFVENFAKGDFIEKSGLISILDQPDYWTEWRTLIERGDYGLSKTQWLTFRKYRLEKLFAERMEALGIASRFSEKAIKSLVSSRQTKESVSSEAKSVAPSLSKQTCDLNHLRSLAHNAIDSMPLHELLQLRIPLATLVEFKKID